MLLARIDLQTGESLRADRVVREHSLHSLHHGEVRSLGHQLAVGGLLQTADVAGVGAVELLVELFAGEDGLVRVDDDDEFAAVDVGREFRAMLAAENVGGGDGGLAERFAGSVEDIPAAFDGFRFCHVCGHTDCSSDTDFFIRTGHIIARPDPLVNPFFEKNPIILIWMRKTSRNLPFSHSEILLRSSRSAFAIASAQSRPTELVSS